MMREVFTVTIASRESRPAALVKPAHGVTRSAISKSEITIGWFVISCLWTQASRLQDEFNTAAELAKEIRTASEATD